MYITPAQRRQVLTDLKISKASIARTCKVKPPAVFQVISGQRPNPPIRLAICQAVAEKTHRPIIEVQAELFPEQKPQEEVAA